MFTTHWLLASGKVTQTSAPLPQIFLYLKVGAGTSAPVLSSTNMAVWRFDGSHIMQTSKTARGCQAGVDALLASFLLLGQNTLPTSNLGEKGF